MDVGTLVAVALLGLPVLLLLAIASRRSARRALDGEDEGPAPERSEPSRAALPPGDQRLVLDDAGGEKIAVIKVLRELTGLDLRGAKDLADRGGVVLDGVAGAAAELARRRLEAAGARVSLHGDARAVPPVAPAQARGDWSVALEQAGDRKIEAIKVLRELTGKGLAEAKELADRGGVVLAGVSPEAAHQALLRLGQVGARAVVLSPAGGEAPAPAAASAPRREPGAVQVVLEDAGRNKIAVIKVVRELTDLGLAEAKGLVDAAPGAVLLGGVSPFAADEARRALEQAGATVLLRG